VEPHDQRRRPSPGRPGPVRVTARAALLLVLAIGALLGAGRLLVAAAPVTVEVVGERATLEIAVDGTTRRVELDRPIVAVRPVAPIAYRREHQIDGSDSTNMLTFDPVYFAQIEASPYYRFQAALREEWRYSTWRRLEVADRGGRVVVRQDRPIDEVAIDLPQPFRLAVELERPEIPRSLALVDDQDRSLALEVNRNDKYVRLGPRPTRDETDLTSWYFPRDWRPPLATLMDLVTRAAALALGLLLVAGSLALLASLLPVELTWMPGTGTLRVALPLGLAALLGASCYVAIALFDRAPHILDAVAYTFQAKTFVLGTLAVLPPPLADAFPVPFSVIWRDRWFAQYPPGTAALLALGVLARLPWLVEPLLATAATALIVETTRRQYGPGTALLVLLLLVTSAFLLLTAGSFLSHVPALFFAVTALYAVTRYAERPSTGWAALVAVGLGLTLLTREIVVIPYGVTCLAAGLALGAPKRGRAIILDALVAGAIVLGAVGLYLAYNAALTGDPFLLPRLIFNPRDLYGFGTGIGFYGEHTVASGLVNTEQQLVSLGFYLAGWPFGFSLALLLLAFLTRRPTAWDVAYGTLAGLFILAYVAEFYHGIAFGPRYYFEALPAFVVLTARGFAALTDTVADWLAALGARAAWWRARDATTIVAVALLACNAFYFLPRQATLYAGYTGLPGGGPALDATIDRDLAGRVSRLDRALVVTDEWWIYVMYFAAMNCPRLDCPTVFALGPDPETRELLRRVFPDRRWYDAVDVGPILRIVPGTP
jgi:hypothetical protein